MIYLKCMCAFFVLLCGKSIIAIDDEGNSTSTTIKYEESSTISTTEKVTPTSTTIKYKEPSTESPIYIEDEKRQEARDWYKKLIHDEENIHYYYNMTKNSLIHILNTTKSAKKAGLKVLIGFCFRFSESIREKNEEYQTFLKSKPYCLEKCNHMQNKFEIFIKTNISKALKYVLGCVEDIDDLTTTTTTTTTTPITTTLTFSLTTKEPDIPKCENNCGYENVKCLKTYGFYLLILLILLLLCIIIYLGYKLWMRNATEYKMFSCHNTSTNLVERGEFQRQESKEKPTVDEFKLNSLPTKHEFKRTNSVLGVSTENVHGNEVANTQREPTTPIRPKLKKHQTACMPLILPEQMQKICKDILNKSQNNPESANLSLKDLNELLEEEMKDEKKDNKATVCSIKDKSLSSPELDLYDTPQQISGPCNNDYEIPKPVINETTNDDVLYDTVVSSSISNTIVNDYASKYAFPVSSSHEDIEYINARLNNSKSSQSLIKLPSPTTEL